MRDSDKGPGPSRAAEEAASWFARLQGTATGDDWLAFERWLQSSPAHVAAYNKVERLWIELDELAPELKRALDAPARRAVAWPAPRRQPWLGWSMGAGVVLAASLTAVMVLQPWGVPIPWTSYQTAAAQTRSLALADGTQVQLNAQSAIAVRLARRERHVRLGDGEAAFDVAHIPDRPFLIDVGDRQIRVVGTAFDLRRRSGETTLTVSRGLVEVRPLAAPEASPIRVALGQQLSLHDAGGPAVLRAVDPAPAYGWTTGRLIYRGEGLGVVAADLSRTFGMSIRPGDAQTAAEPFTGVLVTDSPEAVLRRLQILAPVRAEHTADGIVLHHR